MMTPLRSAATPPSRTAEAGAPYPFSELRVLADGGRIQPIGLACSLSAERATRRDRGRPSNCQLPQLDHLHVFSVQLDFNALRGSALQWPVELGALAAGADQRTLVEFGKQLVSLHLPTKPQAASGVVTSHGLVWGDGSPVAASGTYERLHVIVPVVGLMAKSREVLTAFAAYLGDPGSGIGPLLRACLTIADLDQQQQLVDWAGDDGRDWAQRALFGEPVSVGRTDTIIAIGTET